MKHYAYKARDSHGKAIEGFFEALDLEGAENYFRKTNLIPISYAETQALGFLPRFLREGKVPDIDTIAFIRQLAAAYGAGLSVTNSLDLLARQCPHKTFKRALETISSKIQQGAGLTEAFSEHPQFFDRSFLSILKSGEITGKLDIVLDYASSLLETRLLHKERIRSALLYPKLVIGMIGITLLVVIIYVIPQFAKLYERFQTQLPLPTRILIGLGELVRHGWWVGVLLVPLYIFLWRQLRRHEKFMLALHEKSLKFPILGPLFLKIELSHFCTSFSLLLRAGIPIQEATQTSVNGIKNLALRRDFGKIVPTIEEGGSVSQALGHIKSVPPLMSSIIQLGEESGKLDELLERLAFLYDNETKLVLQRLPTLLEPIILSILFVVVLLLALAVYLPMWKMSGFAKSL